MAERNTYEKILENHRFPYFLVEFDTKKVLYLNNTMKKILLAHNNAIGEVYSQVICDSGNPSYCEMLQEWTQDATQEATIFDNTLKRKFHVTRYSMGDGAEKLCFLEYAPVEEQEDMQTRFQLADHIMDLSTENEEKIDGLLHLLGKTYLGECSYVHIINHENKTIKLRNSWLKPIISETSDYLIEDIEDVAGFDGLILWAKARDEDGIWDCDIERTDSTYKAMDRIALSIFKRKNLLLCGVEDDKGNLVMTTCIGDYQNLDACRDLLKYVTRMIASLIKN